MGIGAAADRCGRPRHHRPHTWVESPDSEVDLQCDGRPRLTLVELRSELAAMCA